MPPIGEAVSGELSRWRYPLARGAVAHVRFTSAADGDLAVTRSVTALEPLREAVIDRPWTWLQQVHGADVRVVDHPGAGAGTVADAAVTAHMGAVLAIHTADCAPLALVSPEGVVGAVHAGWRGLEAGVVPAALDTMRTLGAREVRAVLGPCIHAECYEFGADDLARLSRRLGSAVRGRTATGAPALDLPAAVQAALGDIHLDQVDVCTACDAGYFSHRARGDAGRQALVVWMDEGTTS